MFDLFDQLFLGVLDVDFVDTFAVFHPRCAPFARRSTITLAERSERKCQIPWCCEAQEVCRGRRLYLRASLLAVEAGVSSYGLWGFPLFVVVLGVFALVFGGATVSSGLIVAARLAALAKRWSDLSKGFVRHFKVALFLAMRVRVVFPWWQRCRCCFDSKRVLKWGWSYVWDATEKTRGKGLRSLGYHGGSSGAGNLERRSRCLAHLTMSVGGISSHDLAARWQCRKR